MELKDQIFKLIASLGYDKNIDVHEATPLVGNDAVLDSMKLVELCLNLEEMAISLGFAFDWSTNAALSKSRNIFSTAGTIANEFITQYTAKQRV